MTAPEVADLLAQLATTRESDEAARSRALMGGAA